MKNLTNAQIETIKANLKATRSSLAKQAVKDFLENDRSYIRCGKNGGHGRWSTSNDFTSEVKLILKAAGIANYIIGNDAPRGGKAGALIEIIEKS